MKHSVLSYFIIVILTVLLPIPSLAHGQVDARMFSALVLDNGTGKPLKAVTVRNGKELTTMTNAEGRFSITAHAGDTLTLTCIGYLSEKIAVGDSLTVIKLVAAQRELPELTVKPWEQTMKAILKEQARQLKKGKKLRGNYLYRQTTLTENRPTSIIEAFFEGQNVEALRDLKILTGRYSQIDMKAGQFTHSANFFPLSQMQMFNPEKKLKRWDRILPLQANYKEYYNVEHTVIDYDGRAVYCIDFQPRNPDDDREMFVGKLYVDAQSYSLLATEGEIRNLVIINNYGTIKEHYSRGTVHCSMRYDDTSGLSQVESVNIMAEYGSSRFTSTLFQVGNRVKHKNKTLKPLRDLRQQIDAVGKDLSFWQQNEIILRTRGEQDLISQNTPLTYVPTAANDHIDSLGMLICNDPQIQEKIYVHTDNQCYFCGDTLWYKTYVVSADDLRPTDISRILYVELLMPDGLLVERQQKVLGGDGTAFGQFALNDTIYSGYYELRAYTKWQLNFNVTHRDYSSINRHFFYARQFEKDYFRQYEGLYSRVLPIYEKPDTLGDFMDKRIIPRPKQRVYVDKPDLIVNFYPEGGTLIKGMESRVAFEIKDMEGLAVNAEGVLKDSTRIMPAYQGRGFFTYNPDKHNREVRFEWMGKHYDFKLPKAQEHGSTIEYDAEHRTIAIRGNAHQGGAVAVSCRGRVGYFTRIPHSGERFSLNLNALQLPTGINDVMVFDSLAAPVASRLVFVDNHDKGMPLDVTLTRMSDDTTIGRDSIVAPYDSLQLSIANRDYGSTLSRVSVSVRDTFSDEPTYDNGNILTDMLLSGDLRGFVANPAHYFERDDSLHRSHLDLLMMVQGWRRYKRAENLPYKPEHYFSYDGVVLKMPSTVITDESSQYYDALYAAQNKGSQVDNDNHNAEYNYEAELEQLAATMENEDEETSTERELESGKLEKSMGKKRRKEILVDAELVQGTDIAALVMPTDEYGHFRFYLPDYEGDAILFLTAYERKDSLKKCRASLLDKEKMQGSALPDFYIKRNMFFPQYTEPYSWYQTHEPDILDMQDEETADSLLTNNRLEGDHYLQNVYVRKHRKSKYALDYRKPAVQWDALELYNEVTDWGLSFGTYEPLRFYAGAAVCLFGYLDMPNDMKVRGITEYKYRFFENFNPNKGKPSWAALSQPFVSDIKVGRDTSLKRIDTFSVYSDYDKRKGTHLITDDKPDVTIMLNNIPDEGVRPVARDRRYLWHGIAPAEEFYSPDYSGMTPAEPIDYRRTLYWNPNAKLDDDGDFRTSFFSNSRKCQLKVSACGISADGQIYFSR